MNRLSWIIIICLSVFLISCGNNVSENNPTDTPPPTTTETQTQSEPVASTPDILTDSDLVHSIEGQMPTSYIMELSTTIQDGLTMTVKSTIMDAYSKIETSNSMMPKAMVMLYNPTNKTMYQYAEGDSFGMKFSDVEEGMAGLMDTESVDYSNLTIQDFENEFGLNYTAREETYKGQEVIYIESGFSSEDGVGQIKMWYSNDFFMPLKYELYMEDTLFMTSEVIEFDPSPSLSPKDFEPPEGIEFQELDMDMMQQPSS